jgi:hypothetical protein
MAMLTQILISISEKLRHNYTETYYPYYLEIYLI